MLEQLRKNRAEASRAIFSSGPNWSTVHGMETTERNQSAGILPRVALAVVITATLTAVQAVASRPGASIAGTAAFSTAAEDGFRFASDPSGACVPVAPCSIELARN
jgi:hypothetical protein